VVMLSAPSDFQLDSFPLHLDKKGKLVRLVPAAVLNHFQRGVWSVCSGPAHRGRRLHHKVSV